MEVTECPACGAPTSNGLTVCGECGKEVCTASDQAHVDTEMRQGGKRIYAILVVILAVVGGLALLVLTGMLPNPLKGGNAVAIVNGEKISRQELDQKLEIYKKIYGQSNRADFTTPEGMKILDNMKRQILDAVIQEKILITEAQRENITVDAQEIKAKITAIKKAMNLTDEDFAVFLKNHAMNINDFEKRVEKEFLITKLIAKGTEEKKLAKEAWLKELNARAKVEILSK